MESEVTQTVLGVAFGAAVSLLAGAALWRKARNDSRPAGMPPLMPPAGVPSIVFSKWDLIGVGVVFLIFGLVPVMATGGEKEMRLTTETLLVGSGFQVLIAASLALVVALREGGRRVWGLDWERWHQVFLIGPAVVVFVWLVMAGLAQLGYMEWMKALGAESLQEPVEVLKESKDPVLIGAMAFAAVVVAPLCEELVFRGYCYPALKRFCGRGAACVATALVFSCAHANLVSAVPLFLLGVLFVVVYEMTRSLWAPIAVHFCFNAASVTVQLLARHLGIPLDPGM